MRLWTKIYLVTITAALIFVLVPEAIWRDLLSKDIEPSDTEVKITGRFFATEEVNQLISGATQPVKTTATIKKRPVFLLARYSPHMIKRRAVVLLTADVLNAGISGPRTVQFGLNGFSLHELNVDDNLSEAEFGELLKAVPQFRIVGVVVK